MAGHVQVLLAAYNGMAFLPSLMAGLAQQDYANVTYLARDDGSTDGTPEYLQRLTNPSVTLLPDRDHVGVVQSYYRLLRAAGTGADFLAFCDQDDVWLPGKIRRAVERISRFPPSLPVLYCSRQILVNEKLKRIGLSPLPRRPPGFANALVENIATGCTVVLNRAAAEFLRRDWPPEVLMHDWWAYLVVSAFGRVVYDPEPTVLYRQHGRNVIGSAATPWRRWSTRIRRFFRTGRPHPLMLQARAFQRIYGEEMVPELRRVLERFLEHGRDRRTRWRYAWRPDVYRQHRLDDMIMRCLMVMNRI